MNVVVGSTNPVKVGAVLRAFKVVWPEESWEVTGVEVDSGVSDQPMSDTETIAGARNRAMEALRIREADFTVGLEGGLQEFEGKWFDSAWIIVRDKNGKEGVGSTIRIEMPKAMMDMINAGKELGDVDDFFFKDTNTKRGVGHFGLMTKGALTREGGYTDAVFVALASFMHPTLFN